MWYLTKLSEIRIKIKETKDWKKFKKKGKEKVYTVITDQWCFIRDLSGILQTNDNKYSGLGIDI